MMDMEEYAMEMFLDFGALRANLLKHIEYKYIV